MRKALLTSLMFLVATSAIAQQIKTPRVSPSASLTQTIGVTDMTIKYSRPGVKGRTIWGGLVPYGAVWRTGANEATTISFSDDVTINGQKLAKGTYSLHTIPTADQWTIIFNSVADQWGSYSYDAAKDALRVTVKPEKGEYRERMEFEVPDVTTDTATVVLRWENLAVPFTVNTSSTAKTLAQFRNAMNPDWRVPFQAANFAFENEGAATNDEINTWLDQSLKQNQNLQNLWLKARMLAKAGNKGDAIRYGEMALAAATPAQADLAAEIRRTVDSWKK